MRPSSNLLKPLAFRDAMETHLEEPGDGTLFRLPDDILSLIVQNLAENRHEVDFKSLGTLSPSFRQLARTVLFRDVTFDMSPYCYNGILTFLAAEAFERQQNRRIHGQTQQKASLGACIRKVIVDPWGIVDAMTYFHEPLGLVELELEGPTIAQFETYHVPLIHQVISSLPNLEIVELSGVAISQGLLNSLVGSTVRGVELCARMPAICPRIRAMISWPITNLALNLFADEEFDGILNRSLYWQSILRLCAPTLQQLTISHLHWSELSFDLSFPKLLYLDIHHIPYICPSALRSLLLTSKKLHYLRIDCSEQLVRDVMNTPDEFNNLSILVLHWKRRMVFNYTPRSPLSFIANLRGVTSFAFVTPAPQKLSKQILEELHHFHRLEKLWLSWSRSEESRHGGEEALGLVPRAQAPHID
ncbi:hypothetical protein DHEL01_v203169 [Diaporthe helianthi]|uniref:F-box domain-containing protein n=1 Tax=Diaporthe helianthi TaxID=158607 RepID=A0A2P5I7F7_DIAHE|nr:hypothetical protein DHEL01_v203169 [Diaporthe helianthi]